MLEGQPGVTGMIEEVEQLNYLCVPEQPQYLSYTSGTQNGRAYLYGTEYETGGSHSADNGPCDTLLLSIMFHVQCAILLREGLL